MHDPTNPACRVYIPACLRKGCIASIKVLSIISETNGSVDSLSSTPDVPCSPVDIVQCAHDAPPAPCLLPPLPPPDAAAFALAYKKVANKVRPIAAMLPEDFRNIRRIPVDPLLLLMPLLTHLPDFTPSEHLTQEHLNTLGLNADSFLQLEEEKLLLHVLKVNEMGLAWTEEEKGRFSDEYFSPVKIPVIEHIPWAHKNLPISTSILHNVIKIFKDKTATGVYKHSDVSYLSRPGCRDRVFGLTFSLPNCQLFFLDR